MQPEFNRRVGEMIEARVPFVVATVIRVRGSASARPGSKALIDREGRNVFGWVGGGCAESLVREESLKALEEGRPRIVDVDLDDEVLGVGMPCGGRMDVYLEPQFPPRPLVVAGSGKLAKHLAALGGLLGYAVTVHAPEAQATDFPTAARVRAEGWDSLEVPPGGYLVVASEHSAAPAILHRTRNLEPAFVSCVASRRTSQPLFRRLIQEGIPAEWLAWIRTPAGLDLGCRTIEEISLSVLAEMLAFSRAASSYPLRSVRGVLPVSTSDIPSAKTLGRSTPGAPPDTPPPPELLVVGHGRIAEELARLATLMRWPVSVNSPLAGEGDFPAGTCLITDDMDFNRVAVTPGSYVVVATLHKGDHLSMQRALEGRAAYIGLIASPKRSGLVLDYLRERGFSDDKMTHVHAPAGLDLGAANPMEIAMSIVSEVAAVHRGGSCLPLRDVESAAGRGAMACLSAQD